MEHTRLHHTVVSVPEDWLCYGQFTTCPAGAQCEATDGRGILWIAEVNTLASKSCGDGIEDSEATWFCECSGEFRGGQPDRLQCVDKWITEATENIKDDFMTSEEISKFITENIKNDTETNFGPTGGDLRRIVKSLPSLLQKRNLEPKDDNKGNFTDNVLDSVSILLGLEVGWNEIHEEEVRFETSSEMLNIVDNLGFILKEKIERKECENHDFRFYQVV